MSEKNFVNSEKNSEVGYKNPPKEYQFKPGQSGNPSGRPKGTMKEYLQRKMRKMSDKKKEEFVKSVPHEMQIKLAEGNPKQDSTIDIGLSMGQILDEIESEDAD